ncbi:NAD(P)/FAD-dependent oxidoreductase [Phyllobacterium zundukense]|uniref:FAD-binding oxidoreductase n=1 Tax=Phyllobacterium zundukense TaxID=1867719 RepID=A0ACD4CVN5_9HYPH|nr:FAD-binding oxidoreductase [Phyllobacterium zundukense]UXN57639.1 FAD-binding oxidoreductase [Phyllobacterium zundukense]
MTRPHAEIRSDVIVLGAGIVGVSVALHLQMRGRDVVLVDRRGIGEETSYGNAGLIERSSVIPYGFPRDLWTVLVYALNRSADVRTDWRFLPHIAPWLWRFWRESAPERLQMAAADMLPLLERSVIEHELLMTEAGILGQLRRTGWIGVYRSQKSLDQAAKSAVALESYGLRFDLLDSKALREREPHTSEALIGGIHWRDPASVPDPGGLVKGYADLFLRRGGRFVQGDADTLQQVGTDWTVGSGSSEVRAHDVVVALGPWSDTVLRPLGYRIPLAVKRGYHVHFKARAGSMLHHPVVDVDGGYLLAPMTRGIRLTTGVEFAARDSAPTPLQLARTEPLAREIFPLEKWIDPQPWMGARPCLPDMRPVIGAAPRHQGLWCAFGHNHQGLTLGPVTGRLLADLITGKEPFTDPRPYSIERFASRSRTFNPVM